MTWLIVALISRYWGAFARRPSIASVARVVVRKGRSNHGGSCSGCETPPSNPSHTSLASRFCVDATFVSGTDAPVAGADDGKGIPDDEGILAVVPSGRETGACGSGTDHGLGCARSIEG
ncbi:hypothetical protein K503DRAFT_412615 [Rhizopogon vinicolor AM-OR11-026]|uniref:Secreted protein n=1 Tax=Rhizopogon vinicolor AM-OR11-026 TaxID=1314800 RepID=A0A1B7MQP1_9AGAM|nr:hypothetical protein K503DRAFT_412615 [Rhizopogon vinicolor AM-OR11-026]